MVAMIVAKLYEIKAGRQVLAVSMRRHAEKLAHRSLHVTQGVVRVAVTKHFWTGLSTFAGQKFVEKVWWQRHVQSVTKKASDVVRGKREIKSKGPTSFYLKDVTDYKNHFRSQ